MIRGSLICLLLTGLGLFCWRAPNLKQAADVTMPGAKFNSLSYAPYRAWQSPGHKPAPTAKQVARDLALIAPLTDGIRTYSSIEGDFDIGALAQQAGLHVWLGIWLSANPKDNAREIAAGVAEAKAHPGTSASSAALSCGIRIIILARAGRHDPPTATRWSKIW